MFKDIAVREFYSLLIILVTFTCIYSIFGKEHFSGLDDETNFMERIFNRSYFTITTMSTVGYGDIYPKSMICRLITMVLMMLVGLSLITELRIGMKNNEISS